MARAQTRGERLARAYVKKRLEQAELRADAEMERYKHRELTPEEELRYWNLEDPNVDVALLRAQGQPETAIAALKYPYKVTLMRDGGRANDLTKQVRYVEHMNTRAAEARARETETLQAAFGSLAAPAPAPMAGAATTQEVI